MVVPVHNRRHVVRRAIDSVLAQDMADFELIVVDDGSSDGSAEIVAAIADPRLRLLRQTRSGANAARNRGIRESSAPIIAFLDSDDEYLPHRLGAILAVLHREPGLGTLVDSYAIVHPDKNKGRPDPLANALIPASKEFLAALFTSTVKSRRLRKATSGITVRREVAIRAGLFDESVGRRQDMEFLARAAKIAPCATSDQILWTKYEQAQSISFTGDGFIDATVKMHHAHPEYSLAASHMPADVVIYLCETLQRRRYRQVAQDLGALAKEFGTASTISLLARGAWAWLVDPRRKNQRL